MLAFREGGLDIGEVPTTIAASIIGNEHTATVIGFVQRARWTAPVISLETKPAERSPRSKPETIRYGIVLSAPVMAPPRRERIRTPFQAPKQTGPNAGQIAVLIVIVVVGILLGMMKAEMGSSTKSVHVSGYTRSDGRSVSSYDRAAPGTK